MQQHRLVAEKRLQSDHRGLQTLLGHINLELLQTTLQRLWKCIRGICICSSTARAVLPWKFVILVVAMLDHQLNQQYSPSNRNATTPATDVLHTARCAHVHLFQ